MRVIRRNGAFGTKIEVVGHGREKAPLVLARVLDRPIGRGGGRRDPLPDRGLRDAYVNTAVTRETKVWVKRQADQRGLSVGAFLGMVIEAMRGLSAEQRDALLAGDYSNQDDAE